MHLGTLATSMSRDDKVKPWLDGDPIEEVPSWVSLDLVAKFAWLVGNIKRAEKKRTVGERRHETEQI
jgi:hypothetical protein